MRTVISSECGIALFAAPALARKLRPGLPARPHASTAVRLSVARPGLLDTVGWDAADEPPPPGPGQIGIRVHAAGLNFRDVMWAMGMLPDEALLDGFAGPTLGLECAGEVTAVGEGVTEFTCGDRVMAFAPASLSSHAVTAAHAAVRMPAGLDYAAVGPEHADLLQKGRAEYRYATDPEALAAFQRLGRLEGILPALESAHAIAAVEQVAREVGPDGLVLVNLSGRGDKDGQSIQHLLGDRA